MEMVTVEEAGELEQETPKEKQSRKKQKIRIDNVPISKRRKLNCHGFKLTSSREQGLVQENREIMEKPSTSRPSSSSKSPYEELREKNIKERKALIKSIGLMEAKEAVNEYVKENSEAPKKRKKQEMVMAIRMSPRRMSRVSYGEHEDVVEEDTLEALNSREEGDTADMMNSVAEDEKNVRGEKVTCSCFL